MGLLMNILLNREFKSIYSEANATGSSKNLLIKLLMAFEQSILI